MKFYSFLVLIPILLASGLFLSRGTRTIEQKINGVNFVAPPREILAVQMKPIEATKADWISIIPYGFSRAGEPWLNYEYPRQWWGEKKEGAIATIGYAQSLGYQVMLKPHVWVIGQGWAGDYSLQNEEDWKTWEKDYRKYILDYASIADSMEVDLYCIGTEYRHAVVERPEFWKSLIHDVREIYSGKLTYASNWDNYQNIEFWADLDYIGVDAYFPISDVKTPTPEDLVSNWRDEKSRLEALSSRSEKPILFTEFGYQSMDFAAGDHWKLNKDSLSVNLPAQANSYEGLFRSFWEEPWFAGGFLWKWHHNDTLVGGAECKRFTPQNKPALEVISSWYERF